MDNISTPVKLAMISTIAEVSPCPSGILYQFAMSRGVSLFEYHLFIDTLVEKKLITNRRHMLTWVGPQLPDDPLQQMADIVVLLTRDGSGGNRSSV